MSREEVAELAAPAGDAERRAVDADVSRPPWRKPQMWLLDYTETASMVYSPAGDSESTGYSS